MTEHARAVIVGGGVGGTSIAYHLTAKGWRDVVLLDRAELTSGSTFHSAGLVGQLRSSVALTRIMMWSVECYRRLAAEQPARALPERAGPDNDEDLRIHVNYVHRRWTMPSTRSSRASPSPHDSGFAYSASQSQSERPNGAVE